MKKVLFLFLFAGIGFSLQAQDPVKDIKKAARLLGTYHLDPAGSADKLQEAVNLANASIDDPLVKSDPTAWQSYGDIFMAVTNNDVARFVLDPATVIADPTAPGKAFKGFKMAAELADKTYQTKDAMKSLSAGIQNIYYMGSALYQAGKYDHAYEAFKATYEGFALLKKNNEPNNFDPAEHNKALYYSGLCAEQGNMMDEAKAVYKQLVDEGNADPEVYTALINIYKEEDAALTEKYLKAAREKYPDDTELLYTEINYLLAKGELDGLISRLEKALEMEPNNVSVYVTLGQIYDSKFQRSQEAVKSNFDSISVNQTRLKTAKEKGPLEEAIMEYQQRLDQEIKNGEESFNKAMSYYQQALTKDDKSFDAIYSIGALWYNKAAAYSIELNSMSSDYTPAGTKKYEAKKAQMDESFAKALPFFQQAEEINPKDFNTLIALKEIYARQDKFDLVEQYKQRLEALGNQ